MNENLEKYIKSLPILGLFISIFLYCLLPVIVNTSIYGAFKLYKNK